MQTYSNGEKDGYEAYNEDFDLKLDDNNTYDATRNVGYNARTTRKVNTVQSTRVKSRKNTSGIENLIKWVVIAVIVLFVGDYVLKNINQELPELSNYVDMNVDEIEEALGLELPANESMISQAHQYSNSNVTVNGNDNIGVVYFDGVQGGLYCNSRKYSFFGIELGDYQLSAENNMSYKYDESFIVFDDMLSGLSTTVFYVNYDKGDCLVVVYNDENAMTAAIAYYNNYKKVTEKLDLDFKF